MKFRNTTNSILVLTNKYSLEPFAVSKDFTDKEIQESPNIRYFLGVNPPSMVEVKPGEKVENNVSSTMKGSSEVFVRPKGGKSIEEIDNDPTVVVARPKNVEKSPENITQSNPDVLATMQKEQDEESEVPEELDDEETMVEGETRLDEVQDADDEITADLSSIVKKNDKNDILGGKEKSVQSLVNDASKEIDALTKELDKSLVDEDSIPADIKEFMGKRFLAKKFAVLKSSDKAFLNNVIKHVSNNNIKQWATQRLDELKKG